MKLIARLNWQREFYYMTSGEQNPNKYLIASLIPDKKADLSRNENLTDLEYFIAKDKKNNEVVGLVGLYRHESDRSDTAWLGWFCVDQSVGAKVSEDYCSGIMKKELWKEDSEK